VGRRGEEDDLAREAQKVTFHKEVLSPAQARLLPAIGAFASEHGFYLGGGTAVALYLGHRRSDDFDWFAAGKLEDPMVLAARARSAGLALEDAQPAPGTLHSIIDGVHASFFEYPYPNIAAPVPWTDYSLTLASLDDLACMKLAAVAQRGSRKDLVDIDALAARHRPIGELLDLYGRKYSISDVSHVLIGLNYFDDAEDEPMPAMLRETSWEDVKLRLREWVRSIAG